MVCRDIRIKLQDLLDGTLGQGGTLRIENHLKMCGPCFKRHKQLQLISKAIASLPHYCPTAAFSGKVLAALGLEKEADLLPQWVKWTIGAIGSLMSSWTVGVICLLGPRLSLWKAVDAFHLLANPSELLTLMKLYLAKSAFMLGDFLTTASALSSWPQAGLPIQLAAAAVIAGIFMAVVSKKAPIGAANKKWRTA